MRAYLQIKGLPFKMYLEDAVHLEDLYYKDFVKNARNFIHTEQALLNVTHCTASSYGH
jgi:hypothetical protein